MWSARSKRLSWSDNDIAKRLSGEKRWSGREAQLRVVLVVVSLKGEAEEEVVGDLEPGEEAVSDEKYGMPQPMEIWQNAATHF